MTQQKIQERNEQIALMLGKTKNTVLPLIAVRMNEKEFWLPNWGIVENLYFHSNWNWLMQVVEFIEKLEYEFHGKIVVYISGNNCTIQGSKLRTNPENFHPALFMDFYGKDKIEAVFIAVSDFAKIFNNKEL